MVNEKPAKSNFLYKAHNKLKNGVWDEVWSVLQLPMENKIFENPKFSYMRSLKNGPKINILA